ncbi:MAG: CPXCG motif-containing cysteine-rich protein [Porticoccaceae bacterium]|nr:CPXCG motif-containing cysteine-rich protein [Porticoccaceae bacterium]
MSLLESRHISCPYCGELIELVIDCSISEQNYVEDCFVCCRPIEIGVCVDSSGEIQIIARDGNEV